jgi:hypothetical protein
LVRHGAGKAKALGDLFRELVEGRDDILDACDKLILGAGFLAVDNLKQGQYLVDQPLASIITRVNPRLYLGYLKVDL